LKEEGFFNQCKMSWGKSKNSNSE